MWALKTFGPQCLTSCVNISIALMNKWIKNTMTLFLVCFCCSGRKLWQASSVKTFFSYTFRLESCTSHSDLRDTDGNILLKICSVVFLWWISGKKRFLDFCRGPETNDEWQMINGYIFTSYDHWDSVVLHWFFIAFFYHCYYYLERLHLNSDF